MAESLIDIRKRISSTKKTSQITSAMQMVSASKLIRAEQKVRGYQLYAAKIREIVTHIASTQLSLIEEHGHVSASDQVLFDFHDMLIERPVRKTGYLIISSDKGLAGGYNSSILKATKDMLAIDHASNDEFVVLSVGGAVADDLRKSGIEVAFEIRDLNDQPSFTEVSDIVVKAIQLYRDGAFDALYVCYKHHVNALISEYRAEKMLPLTDLDSQEAVGYEVDYLFEPNKEEILEILLPQYAESLIYGAIIDAKSSEHASRMTAMKSATDNATNMINDMTIQYNRVRQTAITQEITEIVGGASALED